MAMEENYTFELNSVSSTHKRTEDNCVATMPTNFDFPDLQVGISTIHYRNSNSPCLAQIAVIKHSPRAPVLTHIHPRSVYKPTHAHISALPLLPNLRFFIFILKFYFQKLILRREDVTRHTECENEKQTNSKVHYIKYKHFTVAVRNIGNGKWPFGRERVRGEGQNVLRTPHSGLLFY